jgi:hypothetical protein
MLKRLTGVSLCSVKRIAQEGPVGHVDDAAFCNKRSLWPRWRFCGECG